MAYVCRRPLACPLAYVCETSALQAFRSTRHGRYHEVEAVLQKGLAVDAQDSFGNTLLIVACQNGNKRIAKVGSTSPAIRWSS